MFKLMSFSLILHGKMRERAEAKGCGRSAKVLPQGKND